MLTYGVEAEKWEFCGWIASRGVVGKSWVAAWELLWRSEMFCGEGKGGWAVNT